MAEKSQIATSIPQSKRLFAALSFGVASYDDAKAIERAEDGIRSVNYNNGKYDYDLDIYLNETENKQ